MVAGFAAGGYIVLTLYDQFAGQPSQMVWLLYVIGGCQTPPGGIIAEFKQ